MQEVQIERDYEPDEDAIRSAVTILTREPIVHEGKLPKAEEKDTAA
jgi:hypothetical protein